LHQYRFHCLQAFSYFCSGRLRNGWPVSQLLVAASLFVLLAVVGFFGIEVHTVIARQAFGFRWALKLDSLSSFILLSSSVLSFLIVVYTTSFSEKARPRRLSLFYAYFLFTLSFANGAVLADDLVLLLVFWGGMLLTIFGMIFLGSAESYKTATKALIIAGTADICLLVGIALTVHAAGTSALSDIHLPLNSVTTLACILLLIGATAKAGAMPFHSWIPDAAVDAPLPFMALLPGALEKLVGIYFLSRI